MYYKVTIEKLEEVKDKSYPERTTLYEQIFQELPVEQTVLFLNKIQKD